MVQATTRYHPTTQTTLESVQPKLVCCSCFSERIEMGSQPLKICRACKSVWYCSAECQKTAWKTHKLVCDKDHLDTERVKRQCGMNNHKSEGTQYQAPNCLIPGPEETVCQFKEADGTVRSLTQKEFREKVGVTFVHNTMFSQKNLLRLFGEAKINQNTDSKTYAPSDAVALERQGDMGHGVVALKDIPKGTRICPLGGAIERCKDLKKSDNFLEGIATPNGLMTNDRQFAYQTNEYASLGVCINDGPSNCKFQRIVYTVERQGYREVIEEPVVVATRDIQAGEPLFLNYGHTHAVKKGLYKLSESAYQTALDICREEIKSTDDNYTGPFVSIMSTPRIIAQIFLRGDLPDSLMTSLKRYLCTPGINNPKNPVAMLPVLSRFKQSNRQDYATTLDKISQQSLMMLCEYIGQDNPVPSAVNFLIMGKIIDHVIILMNGSLNDDLWIANYSEFYKIFSTDEHQKQIRDIEEKKIPNTLDDGTEVPKLPAPFIDFVSGIPKRFQTKIKCAQQHSSQIRLRRKLEENYSANVTVCGVSIEDLMRGLLAQKNADNDS